MSIRSPSLLFCAAFLSIGGVTGGWVITGRLAGDGAGVSFLLFGGLVALLMFMVLTALYKMARQRVIFLVLFNITLFINLTWYLSCLLLPIFWMGSIGVSAKLGICLFALCLYYVNVAKGMHIFKVKWEIVASQLMRRHYDRKHNVIDWENLVRSLKLEVSLYVPGVPEKLIWIIYVLSLVSIFSGFALRNAFPVYSVFAWGIPVILINAIFMQMIGCGISQFFMLSAVERKDSVMLRPV